MRLPKMTVANRPPKPIIADEFGNTGMGPLKRSKPRGGQPLVAPLPGGEPLVAPLPGSPGPMTPRRARLEDTYQRINAEIDGRPAPAPRVTPRDLARAGKLRGGGGPR